MNRAGALVLAIMALLFLRVRDETAQPLGATLAFTIWVSDTWPRLGEAVASGSQMDPASRKEVRRTGLCALHTEFCKYRGLFRQVGLPFLILSLIALPCWVMCACEPRPGRESSSVPIWQR
jgi:hypothetical protein